MKLARELALLHQALTTPFGIIITTSDVQLTKNHLYKAKGKDGALASLQIRTSPNNPDGELWIVNPKGQGNE